jgi:ABC-type lipoprotein release transport system permease subunit
VLLAAVLGALVLLGALFAGDSVKATLKRGAEERIGRVDHIFTGGDRFFRGALADELKGVEAAPLIMLEGTVTAQGSGRAIGKVQVLGVDERFWSLGPAGPLVGEAGLATPGAREFFVNDHLAGSLGLKAGDAAVLRFAKPSLLSQDAPLSGDSEEGITMRGTVGQVVGAEAFGRFSMVASQLPQATVFVPIERLQEEIGYPGKVNMLLVRNPDGREAAQTEKLIGDTMKLADYGVTLVDVPLAQAVEIRTERIFFDDRVAEVVTTGFPEAEPVVTYLANTIAAKGKEIPYSMVTGTTREAAPFLPEAMQDDGIVLNDWAAADLGAAVGDEVELRYFVVAGGNRLEEASATFTVAGVVPMDGLAADRTWMPGFPGVAEAEDAKDWSPGMPLDLTRIRDQDEKYWDDHRGTPKAWVTAERGAGMWGSRWGTFTGFRAPGAGRGEIEAGLLARLTPAVAGLGVRDFRGEGMQAAKSPVDFAGLFGSMSFFLIVAAVALTALLFRFNVEQRNAESGLLAAIGVPARRVLRWRMAEGLCVVVLGSALAIPLATAYTQGILRFLETIWNTGSGGRLFEFHVDRVTAAGGLVSFLVLVMLTVWLTVRKQAKRSANLRLEAGTEEVSFGRTNRSLVVAIACLVLGLGAMLSAGAIGPQGAFFLAGFLVLLAGLFLCRWRWGQGGGGVVTAGALAALNRVRRPMRSLVVVGTLASGVFLVVAVAAFRKDTSKAELERAGGSGGFSLWVETTRSLGRGSDDLGEETDYFELGKDAVKPGAVQPFRIGAGEDGNCFNLNAVARPRLLATDVAVLAERESFTIKKVGEGMEKSWSVLAGGDVMRAFVDETTMMWVLKAKVGDRITYEDEWGQPFEVEIAGTLKDSVFQGSFVVDEAKLVERFPSGGGYRLFLAEAEDADGMRAEIQKSLADAGVRVEKSLERLEAFHGVENTYIAIFHLLGGLGVVLASAGLGLVTARNLQERRGEFVLMKTIGIPDAVTRSVVFREVGSLIAWGVGIGLVAALVAIGPNLAVNDPVKAVGWVMVLAGVTAVNAWVWSWVGWRAGRG